MLPEIVLNPGKSLLFSCNCKRFFRMSYNKSLVSRVVYTCGDKIRFVFVPHEVVLWGSGSVL